MGEARPRIQVKPQKKAKRVCLQTGNPAAVAAAVVAAGQRERGAGSGPTWWVTRYPRHLGRQMAMLTMQMRMMMMMQLRPVVVVAVAGPA